MRIDLKQPSPRDVAALHTKKQAFPMKKLMLSLQFSASEPISRTL